MYPPIDPSVAQQAAGNVPSYRFKYFNFFNSALSDTASLFGLHYTASTLDVLLPVGISFYTFQSMAYTIDVYRGNIKPERNLLVFASYVAFFPQLVAGPIERASNLIPQFYQQFMVNYDRIISGLRQILWGAFKKVVIADRLSVYVNAVYNNITDHTGLTLIIATVFFAFQIYCDFSGYSDIAIGTARIMGFDLMDNFRQPYFSRSVREFWRRWHISLSTWFRDYVYIPLGGNRVRFSRNLSNLMIVFVVSGLWHGANWTFLIWGTLHGLYIVMEVVIGRYVHFKRRVLTDGMATVLTFVFVTVAWIFFRANTVNDAFYVLAHLFDFSGGISDVIAPFAQGLFDARIEFVGSLFVISLLMIIEWSELSGEWILEALGAVQADCTLGVLLSAGDGYFSFRVQ